MGGDAVRVVRTDERLRPIGTRFLRRRAEALARRRSPWTPSYHLRIEKIGFLRYEVVAYQNRAVET